QTLARWFIHGESFPDPLYMIDLTAAGDIGAGTEEWLYYLKDALGSVMALVSLDTGAVVERYAYDPYGRTEVLVRFAVEYLGGPVEPAGDYFYHDHDFDGDVDAADAADLLACVGSNGPRCVFFHDRNGDGVVTALDVTLMQQVYGGVGEPDQPPPAGHARPNPQQDLVAAGAEVTRADAGGLQACFASSDGWCVALYDADASGTVDLSDVARFAAAEALSAPQALIGIIIDPGDPTDPRLASRFNNPFLWTGQRYDPTTKLYHFWARSYDPNLGRFLQEDMRGPLACIDVFLGYEGDSPALYAPTLLPEAEYITGLQLFVYLVNNPINGIDPYGLFEDEIDDLIGDVTGQRLYALGALNEGAKWAALGLNTALNIAKFLLPGAGLYDAFQSVQLLASGRGGFWDAVNIAMFAFPLVKGAAIGFKALGKARKFGKRACNCFVAGTEVLTPVGSIPIEEVSIGDSVLTRPESNPESEVSYGTVTNVFRALTVGILWITLSSGEVLGVSRGHKLWTSEDGWTKAALVDLGDHLTTATGELVVVVDIEFQPVSQVVYNLEVNGTATYFANGVWVHNVSGCARLAEQLHHALPKFLDGLENGATVALDKALHQEFHGGLYTAIYNAGIRKPRNMKWMDYFAQHWDQYDDALNALMDYTRNFDQRHGTGLIHFVWKQIRDQWW
ncbi:MAG TPA: polymorphic toxin-type HINT domain-containing protein, partial [Phycisphaerae bacterium]|nr:polymorphic toxin-type HINT domain-containing protein [Phycisphaerae bacterium]